MTRQHWALFARHQNMPFIYSILAFQTDLWDPFLGGETESQRVKVTCLRAPGS